MDISTKTLQPNSRPLLAQHLRTIRLPFNRLERQIEKALLQLKLLTQVQLCLKTKARKKILQLLHFQLGFLAGELL
jgi:hypothetical protein